jgi:LacI family transcriptional regulator
MEKNIAAHCLCTGLPDCPAMPRPPSLKSLARSLGLSRTTVSDALRGRGRVGAATIRRVKRAAKAAGYQPNPLVATVLGAINRARGSPFRGSIAVVDLYESSHWPHGPYPRELVAGAAARAEEMGFSISEFVVGSDILPWHRLDSILQSRGIHGVIVLPAWFAPDLSALNWSRYAGIYTDHVTTGPELHSVCPDHYGSMLSLLALLGARGYRRPGLLLQRGRDERVRHRQSAAFCAFQAAHAPQELIPPLITPEQPQFKTEFEPWFRRHRPDVVLSHFSETRDWLKACSPTEMPGLVLLNSLDRSFPCAALDLQPRILGARSLELVVGQILRNEFGVPAWPSHTTVQARWVEGPTVRPPTK